MERRDFLRIGGGGLAASCCAGGAVSLATAQAEQQGIEYDPARMSQAAVKHFMEGDRSCSEAVLACCCEAAGVKSPLLPDLALGLAGGIGKQGKTCGVLTGGTLAISLALIDKEGDYKKRGPRVMKAVRTFYQNFEQEFGSDQCRQLTGLDLTTLEGELGMKAGVKAQKCKRYVETGAKMLAGIIAQA